MAEHEDYQARLEALEKRVAELEAEKRISSAAPWASVPPVPPPPTGQPLARGWTAAPHQPPTSRQPSTAPRADSALNTETVLKWVGLGLVSLAAVFLVTTAIQRGWIGPELQLVGSIAVGAGLVAVGVSNRLRLPWRLPLVISGFVVWFVSCGAAWDWLGLVSATGAGVAAVVVGTGGLVFADRVRSGWMITVSFAGLVAVPMWADLQHVLDPWHVQAYLALLTAVAGLLYRANRWPVLWMAIVSLTALFSVAAASEFSSASQYPGGPRSGEVIAAVGGAAVLALVQWFVPVGYAKNAAGRPTRKASTDFASDDWLASPALLGHEVRLALAIPAWFLLVLGRSLESIEATGANGFGLAAAGTGAFCLASAFVLKRFSSKVLFLSQCMAGGIALSIAAVSLFDGQVMALVLMMQAAAMLVFVSTFDDGWFSFQVGLLAAIGTCVGFGFTIAALVDNAPLLDDAIHGVALVFLVIIATARFGDGRLRGPAKVGLGVAWMWLFVWVASTIGHWQQGQVLVSATWALLAASALWVAIWLGSRPLLRGGFAALTVTILKLLSVDLAAVDTFWRVGLFFMIGVGLLAFGYQIPRLMNKHEDS